MWYGCDYHSSNLVAFGACTKAYLKRSCGWRLPFLSECNTYDISSWRVAMHSGTLTSLVGLDALDYSILNTTSNVWTPQFATPGPSRGASTTCTALHPSSLIQFCTAYAYRTSLGAVGMPPRNPLNGGANREQRFAKHHTINRPCGSSTRY